jgi:hypothetical protein
MEVPHEAILLRIFTSVDNRYGVEEPLYHAIVMKAREMHLAGATVLKGPLGFGQWLVTLERARVLQYGRKRSSYLDRLKESMRHHLHIGSRQHGSEAGSTRPASEDTSALRAPCDTGSRARGV